MDNLGINLGYFLSQLVNFALLALLLHLLLYKPILNMLHQRRERIARGMADADAARETAAKAQAEYDRRIAEAQRRAQEIIAEASHAGERAGAEIVAAAERDGAAIRQAAREEAAREKVHLLQEAADQIAGLSLMAAERVLGQAVDADAQRELVDRFLAELGDDGKP